MSHDKVSRRRFLKYAGAGVAVVAAAAAAYAIGRTSVPSSKSSADTILVGYDLELTGPGSALGNEYLAGMTTWALEKNNAGGIFVQDLGKKLNVQVIGYDNKSDANVAAECAKRLVSSGVHVVGPVSTVDNVLAMMPTIVDAKVPFILGAVPSQTAKSFGNALWNIIYPSWNFFSGQPKPIFDYLMAQKDFQNPSTLAYTYPNTALGQDHSSLIPQYADKAGIKIVFSEAHSVNQTDYSDLMQRIVATKPDMIAWCAQYGGDAVTFTRNLLATGYKPKILFDHGLGVPGVVSSLGPLAEGHYADVFWNPDMKSPGASDFISLFKAVNKHDATYPDAIGYSAMQIYEAGVAAAGSIEPAKVAAALSKLQGVTTVGGAWSVNAPNSFVLVQCTKGQLNTIFPTQYSSTKGRPTNP